MQNIPGHSRANRIQQYHHWSVVRRYFISKQRHYTVAQCLVTVFTEILDTSHH